MAAEASGKAPAGDENAEESDDDNDEEQGAGDAGAAGTGMVLRTPHDCTNES